MKETSTEFFDLENFRYTLSKLNDNIYQLEVYFKQSYIFLPYLTLKLNKTSKTIEQVRSRLHKLEELDMNRRLFFQSVHKYIEIKGLLLYVSYIISHV